MEVHASPRLREYGDALKELLLTVKSPAFFEVVVIFSEEEVRRPPLGLASVLREMYEVREFRVVYCLETIERIEASMMQALTLEVRVETALGSFDFLPCLPLVSSRTLSKYDCLRNP